MITFLSSTKHNLTNSEYSASIKNYTYGNIFREKSGIISEQILQKNKTILHCPKNIFHALPLSISSPDTVHRGAVWAVPTVYVQYVLNVLNINVLMY
jgi:hypothetical protein